MAALPQSSNEILQMRPFPRHKWTYSTHAKAGLSLPFAKHYPPGPLPTGSLDSALAESQDPLTKFPLEIAYMVFGHALPMEIRVQHIGRYEQHKESAVKIVVNNNQQSDVGDGQPLLASAAVSKSWRQFVKHCFYEEHAWSFDDCWRLRKFFNPLKCRNKFGVYGMGPEANNNEYLFEQLKPTLHRIRKLHLVEWHRSKFLPAMKCLLQLNYLTSVNISSRAIDSLIGFAKSRSNAAREARLDPNLAYPANFEDDKLVVFADAPQVKEFCDGFLAGCKCLADEHHESLLRIVKVDVENLVVKTYTRHQLVYDLDVPRPSDPLYKIVGLWEYLHVELRDHLPVWRKTQRRRKRPVLDGDLPQPKKRRANSAIVANAAGAAGAAPTIADLDVPAQNRPPSSPTTGAVADFVDGWANKPNSIGSDATMSLGPDSTNAAAYGAALSRPLERVQSHTAVPLARSTGGRCTFPMLSAPYDHYGRFPASSQFSTGNLGLNNTTADAPALDTPLGYGDPATTAMANNAPSTGKPPGLPFYALPRPNLTSSLAYATPASTNVAQYVAPNGYQDGPFVNASQFSMTGSPAHADSTGMVVHEGYFPKSPVDIADWSREDIMPSTDNTYAYNGTSLPHRR